MSQGDFQVRNPSPHIEAVYPLAEWIQHELRSGKVYRRTIIVVEDWAEVEELAGTTGRGAASAPHPAGLGFPQAVAPAPAAGPGGNPGGSPAAGAPSPGAAGRERPPRPSA